MYCRKCGTEQKPGQKFCPKCGEPFALIENEGDNSSNNEDVQNDYSTNVQSQLKAPLPKSISFNKGMIVLVAIVAIIGIIVWGWNNLSMDKVVDVFTSYEKESTVDGIPFKSSEKGKWGMLKPDGTILFEEEFKDVPTVAHDGRFLVKNGNGLWEIFTAEEKPQKVGDEYKYLGEFYNGVAPAVKENEHITLIDKNGNVIAVLDKSGAKPITRIRNFHYGYALFDAGDAVGIVNTRGEILLDARKYYDIHQIAPKKFLALDMKYKDEDDQHKVYDVIDPVGNKEGTIRMAKYNSIADLDDGYIGIEQTSDGEKLYGIMNLKGEIIVRPTSKIKGLYGYNDGKYIFSDGEYWGVRTIKDEVLIRAKYDAILWASSDMIWAVSIDDEGRKEVSLVDLEGNKITREAYQDALPFYDGKHAFVQITDKTWGLIDNKGEELRNAPDIYTIECNSADDAIWSDYLDMDAIVSSIGMTPNGFGGFGIHMSPIQLIKNYNENCEDHAKIALDPNTAHIDRLSYKKEVLNGVEVKVNLYYSGYMTESGERYYDNAVEEWIQQPNVWTKEHPQYIKMTVSGNKLSGKTNVLYKKLLVKAKTYGKVYKENDNACIIVQKNKNGLVIVNTGSEVWAMVKDMESLRSENIEQYSQNETHKGGGYEDYINPLDLDSIEEDGY